MYMYEEKVASTLEQEKTQQSTEEKEETYLMQGALHLHLMPKQPRIVATRCERIRACVVRVHSMIPLRPWENS